MSIHIQSIELCNWFQFKGPYNENKFDFNKGLNIIIGNNNAGKTKLHNAFRYMLTDLVRLEKTNRKDENDNLYEEYPIDENTISKVFNQRMGLEMKDGMTATLGVKMTFQIKKDEFNFKTYLLEKSIKVKKNLNEIILHEKLVPKVSRIDRRTKKPRTTSEEFQDVVAKIIPNDFKNFFFIESEQKGIMIPLKGSKLKNTINSIVKLDFLDKIEKNTKAFSKSFEKLKSEIDEAESRNDKERMKLLKRKKELSEKNEHIDEAIISITEDIKTNEGLVEEYKRMAEKSEKQNELIRKLDSIKAVIDSKEELVENNIRSLIKSYLNKSIFSIRKLNNDNKRIQGIDSCLEGIKLMISERRIELDSRLSKKEQKWMYALEKSQPKPEIIQSMVDINKCFVCSQDLNEEAKAYMKDKLIPFFRNELEDDKELENLENIRNLITSFKLNLNSSLETDLDFFQEEENKIIGAVEAKREAESKKNDFIELHGNLSNVDVDRVSFITYDKAKTKLFELRSELEDLSNEHEENKTFIETVVKGTTDNPKSAKLIEAEELSTFMTNVAEAVKEVKRNEYSEFADELSKKITIRYQNFMANNKVSKDNTIEVLVQENARGEYNFEIKVKDKFGEYKSEAGGADSGLRRVAVVFGLLDITETKKGYPFIADAPVSALSPEAKKDFFITLLNDQALKQCIIMSMDLWDSKRDTINELGIEVKNILKKKGDNRMMTIINKNDAKVELDYIS